MTIKEQITTALEQLGYNHPNPDIAELDTDRYVVRLNGAYFGVWDSLKHTFVD